MANKKEIVIGETGRIFYFILFNIYLSRENNNNNKQSCFQGSPGQDEHDTYPKGCGCDKSL